MDTTATHTPPADPAPRSRVCVAIPLYRSQLHPDEVRSIRRTCAVLNRYRIVLLLPEGIDVPPEAAELEVLRVSDEWLGTKNGLAGYNRMMLSAAFYDLFPDEEYLLICHADAWIFRDELEAWCDRGYDCVAAPWVRRPVYDLPIIRQWMAFRLRRAAAGKGKPIRQLLYGRIGNGGLSLRRIASFRRACDRYRSEIDRFLSQRHHLYNEDVFWATVPQEFRYPAWREACEFAFDTNPAYCYRLTGGKLPFGCHSWSKRRYYPFWKPFIG